MIIAGTTVGEWAVWRGWLRERHFGLALRVTPDLTPGRFETGPYESFRA